MMSHDAKIPMYLNFKPIVYHYFGSHITNIHIHIFDSFSNKRKSYVTKSKLWAPNVLHFKPDSRQGGS